MTAAIADQLPLQIKMYKYDRLPVQLATRLLVRDGRAASARAIRYKVHALDPSSLSFDYKPVKVPALLVLYGNYWAQGKFSCE